MQVWQTLAKLTGDSEKAFVFRESHFRQNCLILFIWPHWVIWYRKGMILGKSASLQLELKDELCSLRLASKSFFEDLGGTSLWWPRCKCVSLYPHGLLSLNWLHSTFSVGKLSSPMYFVKKYCHSTTLSFLYPQCLYNHGDSLLSISKSLEKRIWLDQPSKRGREKRWV